MIGSEPCFTCGGALHASGLPCVCGGVGTRDAETNGLRRYAFELESAIGTVRPALKWILNHAPSPDKHALAGHAKVALDRIAEVSRYREQTTSDDAIMEARGWKITTQGYVKGPWRLYCAETWCVAFRESLVRNKFTSELGAAAWVDGGFEEEKLASS